MRTLARAVGIVLALGALLATLLLWRSTREDAPAAAPGGAATETTPPVASEIDALQAPSSVTLEPAPAVVSDAERELVATPQESKPLPLPAEPMPDFHGVVIDDETELPINGALVDGEDDFMTDAAGAFALRRRQGRLRYAWADVTAAGYGKRVIHMVAGHETAERALVVRLMRAATLEIAVREASGAAVGGARIRAITDESGLVVQESEGGTGWVRTREVEWRGETGPDGRCTLAGVAPRAPLRIRVERPALDSYRYPYEVELEPGETRALEILLGAGATVHGRALDQHDQPVVGWNIWLVPQESLGSLLNNLGESEALAKATTDAAGRFELHDVPPGSWFVGPGGKSLGPPPTPDEDLARDPDLVNVAEGERSVEVELRLDRGLWLRGIVLDPEGVPASGEQVIAQGYAYSRGETDRDGAFALGPLPRGDYMLVCGSSDLHLESLPVRAAAGDRDIVLRLRSAARVSGRVVDAVTGEPCRAEVHFAGPTREGLPAETTADGAFLVAGLDAGVYSFAAVTQEGAFAFATDIHVVTGEHHGGLLLRAARGGRLRVTYKGQAPVECAITAFGVEVQAQQLDPGSTAELAVPAEECVVVLRHPFPVDRIEAPPEVIAGFLSQVGYFAPSEHPIRVIPGETVEIVLGE